MQKAGIVTELHIVPRSMLLYQRVFEKKGLFLGSNLGNVHSGRGTQEVRHHESLILPR